MIDTITLANKSGELLKNEAFLEAARRVETGIIDTWKQTGPRDKDERESLYYQQQALASVVGQLTDMKTEPDLYAE